MTPSENDHLALPLTCASRACAFDIRDISQRPDLRDETGERIIPARRVVTRCLISDSGPWRAMAAALAGFPHSINHDATAWELSTLSATRGLDEDSGFSDVAQRAGDENFPFKFPADLIERRTPLRVDQTIAGRRQLS